MREALLVDKVYGHRDHLNLELIAYLADVCESRVDAVACQGGSEALYAAAVRSSGSAVEILLRAGADPHRGGRREQGFGKPLHHAATPAIALQLLRAGARPLPLDGWGRMASERHQGQPDSGGRPVARLLRRAEAFTSGMNQQQRLTWATAGISAGSPAYCLPHDLLESVAEKLRLELRALASAMFFGQVAASICDRCEG